MLTGIQEYGNIILKMGCRGGGGDKTVNKNKKAGQPDHKTRGGKEFTPGYGGNHNDTHPSLKCPPTHLKQYTGGDTERKTNCGKD